MSATKTKPYATKPFKPLNTKWLSMIIGLVGGLLIIDIITSLVMVYFYGQVSETLLMDEQAFEMWQAQIATAEMIVTAFSVALILVFVVSMVLVGKWIYDSQHNARALGVPDLQYSPTMAVGSFFIPIVGLFLPFVAMQQMVNGSFEKAGKPTFHPLILLWWVCFVMSSIANRILSRQVDKLGETYEASEQDMVAVISYFNEMTQFLWLFAITSMLALISAWALWVIIKRTTALHQQMSKNGV